MEGFLFDFSDFDPPKKKGGEKSEPKKEIKAEVKEEPKKEKTDLLRGEKNSFLFVSMDGKESLFPEKNSSKTDAHFFLSCLDLVAQYDIGGKKRTVSFPFFLWNQRADFSELKEKVFSFIDFY